MQEPAAEAGSAEPAADDRTEEEKEAERQRREAEFDEQLRARAVRADCLGQDRHFRRYWWLQGVRSQHSAVSAYYPSFVAFVACSTLQSQILPLPYGRQGLFSSINVIHDNMLLCQ